MNQYRVKFSKKSYSHLLEIKNYIKDTLQAPLTAKEFLNKLCTRIFQIWENPFDKLHKRSMSKIYNNFRGDLYKNHN